MKKTALILILAMLVSLFAIPVSAETETPVVPRYGDVNVDGKINSTDAVLMARKLAKWEIKTFAENAADINNDQKFNSTDAVLLKRYLAKWSLTGVRIGEEIVLPASLTLEGKPITEYKIVIPATTLSLYDKTNRNGNILLDADKFKGVDLPNQLAENAADYINDEIEKLTGTRLTVITDATEDTGSEIVIGSTSRVIAKEYNNSELTGMKFGISANEEDVLLSGKDFLIAGAAYYFVNTLIAGNEAAEIDIPDEGIVEEPTPETPKNFIYFIGDGMGQNHPKLLGSNLPLVENEYILMQHTFAGYRFPNQGLAKTRSADNEVTDSAAGGTALATGYKTNNHYVGLAPDGKTVLTNLSELAHGLGYKTAVLSTDTQTGATPSAFSAHVLDRGMAEDIKTMQDQMLADGTIDILRCGFGDNYFLTTIENTLSSLTADNEKGFFMMYEEAHIDKNSHQSMRNETYWAMARGNMAIIKFMEFAMYHPDTMMIITADHETGGLTKMGTYQFTSGGKHTGADVPVIGYGLGTEIFNGATVDNTAIPKVIAKMLGFTEPFGDPAISGEPLTE